MNGEEISDYQTLVHQNKPMYIITMKILQLLLRDFSLV